MPRPMFVTEISLTDSKHVAYHEFDRADFNEPGHYRQSVSFCYFFQGVKKRNWSKDRLYYGRAKAEVDPKWSIHEGVPFIRHADLWSFYKAIGYDYKTQKWSKT